MYRRILAYVLLFTFIASFAALGLTYGSSERKKLLNVQSDLKKNQGELDKGKAEEKDLLNQIKALESKMLATQSEIDVLKRNINQTQDKINTASEELKDLEGRLAEQNDYLNARLRAMYMNGNIGVIDVLLGSGSITDFMTNMDRVQLIYESDREVIESLEEQHLIIDTQRQYLEGLKAELIAEKEKEASKKAALKQNQDQIAIKKTEVAQNNKLLEQCINELNAEADRLISEILAMQSDTAYVGGEMMWPVPGATRITSEFGYRVHPILKYKKYHTGIDIAVPTGTKVVAANAGRVMKAGWNNSYGFLVMIDHGGGKVTLYAHNSNLLVSDGDIVKRGQAIARSGSTGMSTGPHVHFEVRVNGECKDPKGYV